MLQSLVTLLVGMVIGVLLVSCLCAYIPGFEEHVYGKLVEMYPNRTEKKKPDDKKED